MTYPEREQTSKRLADVRVGVLAYCVGERHICALLIDQSGDVQSFKLLACDIALPLIDALFEVLEGRRTENESKTLFHRFAFDWGKNLLPPSQCLERFDVLVIIPHYTLHGVPFHAIQLEVANQFLGVSHAITYCSSATLFTRCVDRNVARDSVLGVEYWTYALEQGGFVNGAFAPTSCYALGFDAVGDQTEQFQRLAAIVAGCFEKSEVDMKATRRLLKFHLDKIEPGEVLCIAAHGYCSSLISHHSGLMLAMDPFIATRDIRINKNTTHAFRDLPMLDLPAGFDSTLDAELLTLGELRIGCNSHAQLVALFACSTGAGEVLSGGDVNSLAYQWLKVGAASVLANLWELNLDFAMEFAPEFFRRWITQRQPKAIAWQQTLKHVVGGSSGADPYQWGTMALFGDWL